MKVTAFLKCVVIASIIPFNQYSNNSESSFIYI